MKAIKTLAMAALATAVFASCYSEHEYPCLLRKQHRQP